MLHADGWTQEICAHLGVAVTEQATRNSVLNWLAEPPEQYRRAAESYQSLPPFIILE
jgi:hypothetical protein